MGEVEPLDGAEPRLLPSLGGAVAGGVAMGVVALLAGLLLAPARTADPTELTNNGAHNFRPEWDAAVYIGAVALGVTATVVLSRRRRESATRGWPAVSMAVPVVAAAAATAAFLDARASPPTDAAGRLSWAGAALVLLAVCAAAARAAPAGIRAPWRAPLEVPARQRSLGLVDLVVPALIVALLYTPAWRELAGNAFAGEGALHLDFFGLGPAQAYESGLTLGTDVHPYYGVGWAMVLARLDVFSYGHLIRFEVLYACAYFTGVYLLVRRLTGDRRWGAVGAGLAVLFQLFTIFPSEFVLWRFPSATVLRWPFDVWFFLACLLAVRSRHRAAWTVAAAALVGLTAVFQTETVVALGLAFVFWCAARWRVEGGAALRALPAATLVAGGVVVVGLGVASRWTLFTADFWSGWLENVRLGSEGATLLPITGVSSWVTLGAFVAVTAAYLAFLAFAVVQVARGSATTSAVMFGSIALYGLVTFVYFVGRSNPHNLFRSTVPLAVLLASAAGLVTRAWAGRRPVLVPWLAIAATVVAMAADPGVRSYPGLLRSLAHDVRPPGDCLVESPRDVCGLPPEFRGVSTADVRSLVARLRAVGSEGLPLAVVDEIGPIVPYLAGARPWGRYSPLFPTLFTAEQRRAVLVELKERPPPLLVMRTMEAVEPFYRDSWHVFRPTVERDFVLDSRHGGFEIWRRQDVTRASRRGRPSFSSSNSRWASRQNESRSPLRYQRLDQSPDREMPSHLRWPPST